MLIVLFGNYLWIVWLNQPKQLIAEFVDANSAAIFFFKIDALVLHLILLRSDLRIFRSWKSNLKILKTIKRSVFFNQFGKYLKKVWKVVQTWCEALLIKKVFHVCLTNSNSIQLCGMYIILTEISFLKHFRILNHVHNVRKWPNYVLLALFCLGKPVAGP
jgi:hypothetical protein